MTKCTLIEKYGIDSTFVIGDSKERFMTLTKGHPYRSKWGWEEFYNGWLEGRMALLRELEEKMKEKAIRAIVARKIARKIMATRIVGREMCVCDVDNCTNEAVHICAKCKCDICDSSHSHAYGDGGHIEHSVRVAVISMKYQGEVEFFLCPRCYIETGLEHMKHNYGKPVEID